MKLFPYLLGFFGLCIGVTADWWFPANPWQGISLGLALIFLTVLILDLQERRS